MVHFILSFIAGVVVTLFLLGLVSMFAYMIGFHFSKGWHRGKELSDVKE